MLKMLLDPMGGIVLSNDGFYHKLIILNINFKNKIKSHAILREIDVNHPAVRKKYFIWNLFL